MIFAARKYFPPSEALYYDYGDEKIDLTGGWIFTGGNNQGTVSKEEDHLYMSAGPQEYSSRRYETANGVSLRHFNTVKAYINLTLSSASSTFILSILDPVSGSVVSNTSINTSGNHTVILDVSAYTGEYVVRVGVSTGTSASVTVAARVYKVWAER